MITFLEDEPKLYQRSASRGMTRQQKLDILMLLSALESWGFSTQSAFPDYLHDRLTNTMELLSEEVLNANQGN